MTGQIKNDIGNSLAMGKPKFFLSKEFTIILVLAAMFSLYFVHLGGGSLKAWDEGLTALRSFEMLQDSHFPTCTLYGHPDFNKPPLYYQLTAWTMGIFGISIFSVRFPSVFLAIATQLIALLFVRRYTKSAACQFLAVALLLFNAHWMDHVRMGLLESGISLSIILAVYLASCNNIKHSWKVVFVGLALGGGSLIKHPGGFISLYLIAYIFKESGDRQWIKSTFFVCVIAVGVYFLWILSQYILWDDKFINYYFKYNIYERFTNGIEGHATKPTYYIERIFTKAPLSASLVVLSSIWGFFNFRKNRVFSSQLVALLLFLLQFVVLSCLTSKREEYLISLYPLLAIVFPLFLNEMPFDEMKKRGIVALLVFLEIAFFIPRFDVTPEYSKEEKQAVDMAISVSNIKKIGVKGMPFFLARFYGAMNGVTIEKVGNTHTPTLQYDAVVLPRNEGALQDKTIVFRNESFIVKKLSLGKY